MFALGLVQRGCSPKRGALGGDGTERWEAAHVPDTQQGEKIDLSGPLPHGKWTLSRLYSRVEVRLRGHAWALNPALRSASVPWPGCSRSCGDREHPLCCLFSQSLQTRVLALTQGNHRSFPSTHRRPQLVSRSSPGDTTGGAGVLMSCGGGIPGPAPGHAGRLPPLALPTIAGLCDSRLGQILPSQEWRFLLSPLPWYLVQTPNNVFKGGDPAGTPSPGSSPPGLWDTAPPSRSDTPGPKAPTRSPPGVGAAAESESSLILLGHTELAEPDPNTLG
uniref:Uncharacterized protein n=1 Tax=Molossus molossus TaxID=27622 RepID=A0A7J8BYN3_MOLMO|nr:hypothetical protein HJG59_010096 [Molossus molossus]